MDFILPQNIISNDQTITLVKTFHPYFWETVGLYESPTNEYYIVIHDSIQESMSILCITIDYANWIKQNCRTKDTQ